MSDSSDEGTSWGERARRVHFSDISRAEEPHMSRAESNPWSVLTGDTVRARLHEDSKLLTVVEGGKNRKLNKHATKFEILDYDPYVSTLHLREEAKILYSWKGWFMSGLLLWTSYLLVGLVTGLIDAFILWSIDFITDKKISLMQYAINHGGGFFVPLFILVMANVAIAGAALTLTVALGMRSIPGGIDGVVAQLNCIKVSKSFRFRTLVGKIFGTILMVAGGFMCGPEASLIQIGAIIGASLPQAKSTSLPIDLFPSLFALNRNDHEKLESICAGVAAGMSAAFGAPISGVLLMLEEGASFWNRSLILKTFLCACASKFVISALSYGLFTESVGVFHQPGFLFFGSFRDQDYQGIDVTHLLFFIPLAVFCGVCGLVFVRVIEKLGAMRKRFGITISGWKKLVEGMAVLLLTSFLSFVITYWVHQCSPLPPAGSHAHLLINADFQQFYCKHGEFNDMATLWLNGMDDAVKQMWHNPTGFSTLALGLYGGLSLVLMCYTLGLAIPAGLLVPSLMIGGAIGRAWAQFLNDYMDTHIDVMAAALVGSVSILTALTRLTITVAALVIETSNQFRYSIPVILGILVTKWTADLGSENLIEVAIEQKELPFMHWEPPAEFDGLRAVDVMNADVDAFFERESVRVVYNKLKSSTHNAFPVVSREYYRGGRKLQGIISRQFLITMLKHKVFYMEDGEEYGNAEELELKDFQRDYPRYPHISTILLTESELDKHMSLRPYMNRWPHTLRPTATLTRVFRLFRLMGLRHVVVTDHHNNVVGIITRKDLTDLEHAMHKLTMLQRYGAQSHPHDGLQPEDLLSGNISRELHDAWSNGGSIQ